MVLEFNSVAAIIECVAVGLGVTLLPEIAEKHELELKKLIALPWSESTIEVAQLMIWHKEKWLSPIMKGFMDTTREVLKDI
jgi:DNA-binding transcriptional LysR family regulator